MTYLQISPAFLELVFPFGLQHYAQGFHFSGFTAENRLLQADRGLEVTTLRRSGRHTEVCYSLKSVERTPDPNNPWSIRQCSVVHRFDVESEQATWIIVKGNSLMQELVKSYTLNELTSCDEQSQREGSAFGNSLNVHILLASWAGEDWHWYINDLEEKLQSITRPAVSIPIQPDTRSMDLNSAPRMTHHSRPPRTRRKWSMRTVSRSMKRSLSWSTVRTDQSTLADEKALPPVGKDVDCNNRPLEDPFSFRDLQSVQFLQEKASEVLLILRSNRNVLESLRSNYVAIVDHEELGPMLKSAEKTSHAAFQQTISAITKKVAMGAIEGRSFATPYYRTQDNGESISACSIKNRWGITAHVRQLHAILQHRNMEANNRLAQEAKVSAKKMEEMTLQMHEIASKTKVETVSMRIITLVTLFFLPGTFISVSLSRTTLSPRANCCRHL